jgi:hypothetical protein
MLLAFHFGALIEQGIRALVFAIHMVQLCKENGNGLSPVFNDKVRLTLIKVEFLNVSMTS